MTAAAHTNDMSARSRTAALVVFESMFGNTSRAARAVADGLRAAGAHVDLVDVGSAPVVLPADLDLVVVAAPTHAFGLSRASTRADAVRQGAKPEKAAPGVREWLQEVQVPSGRSVLVAAVDTHVSQVRWIPKSASTTILRLARRRGLTPVGRHLGLIVNDVKGPLADGERERAVEYGTHLALRCRGEAAPHP